MKSDKNGQLKNNMIYKQKGPHLSEEIYDNNISNDLPKNYSMENLEEVMHMNMNNNNNDKIYNDEEEDLEAQIQNNQNKYQYENNYNDRNEDINMSNNQNNSYNENENNEEINHIQNNSNENMNVENDDIKENNGNIENLNSSQNNNQNLYDSEENNDIDEDTFHKQNINNNNINLNNNEDKNKNYNNNNIEDNIKADISDNIYQEKEYENENEMNKQNKNEILNLPLSLNSNTKNKKYNIQKENEKANEYNSNIMTNEQNQNKIDYMEDKGKEGDVYHNNFTLNENTELKASDNESNNNTDNINKNTNYKELTIKISDGVKFGVDVSGNPVDISHFDENKDNNKNKIIAFIIEKENENNFLIDIKGNVLKKTDDDYYCYKEGEEFIIIKDFDIQHPELRVYGHRKIHFNELQNGKNEEIKEESNFEKYKFNDNNYLNDKNDNKIQDYETNLISPITNINKKEKDKNNIILNKNIDEMILNNINNKADIIQENNNNNDKKVKSSTYFKTDGNSNIKISNEFKYQMVLWRHRYGKKNEYNNNIINKSDYRNYSYNDNISVDKMINRTGSILNLASGRIIYNKQSDKSRKIPISLKNNKYFYNKNALTEAKIFDGFNYPLNKNQNNSFTKKTNNPLLNHYKRRNILINENIYAFKRLNLNKDEKTKTQRIPRNLTFENFNIKNNKKDKSSNLNYKKNLELQEVKYQIRDDIMKNIRNKNKRIKNTFHLINKSENLKNMDISNEIKGHDINKYIHYNLTKMNENKFRKKNLSIKYSILSDEANQLIKNFSRKQTETNENKNIVLDTMGGYTKYSDRDIKYNYNNYIKNKNKRNDLIKDSYSYYDKNPNLYFNYEIENENEITDSDDSQLKILPNKLQKHKISILNNNFYKADFERQNKNRGDFYQRIKHHTSYNNYKKI